MIGLRYASLPLAVEFGKKQKVVGFDINKACTAELRAGKDNTLEVDAVEMAETANKCSKPTGVTPAWKSTYHRFALNTTDVEGLLAERSVIVSKEAVRSCVNRFGRYCANCIRGDGHHSNDK